MSDYNYTDEERDRQGNPEDTPKRTVRPKETVDENGFRVLTLYRSGEKSKKSENRRQVLVSPEEEALEDMLENNSNKSQRVHFASAPPEEPEKPAAENSGEPAPKRLRRDAVEIELEEEPIEEIPQETTEEEPIPGNGARLAPPSRLAKDTPKQKQEQEEEDQPETDEPEESSDLLDEYGEDVPQGRIQQWISGWLQERLEGQEMQSAADEEYEKEHLSPAQQRKQAAMEESRLRKAAKAAAELKKKQQPPRKQGKPSSASGSEQKTQVFPAVGKGEKPKPSSGKQKTAKSQQTSAPDNVIQIPQERPGVLGKKFNNLREQADEFADAMFVSDSVEAMEEERQQKRVAKLIPATDEERIAGDRQRRKAAKAQKEKKNAHRAPDTSPRELYHTYNASWKSQSRRLPLLLVIALVLLVVSGGAEGTLSLISIPFLAQNPRIAALILTAGLAAACVAGLDTLLEGVVRLGRGRPGLNTLCSFGCVLAVLDGAWYVTIGREGPLPFCGCAALSLWAMALGNRMKTRGLRDACEDAYTRSEFERLTMDANKWNGRGVYQKDPGDAKGFGSQIQELDGAERVFRYAAAVIMAACVFFGAFSAVGQKSLHLLLWNWSVIFVMATPLSATLAYGMPYARHVRRLHRSGAVLAGWDGVVSLHKNAGIILTDRDLFPEGTVQMHMDDIHKVGDVSLEKLTGCTASIVRQADLGIVKLFDDQIRIQGGFYRRVDELDTSEEGGCTGVIRGDTVMIGTAGFMEVHGVHIQPGYRVKNAVFCVINGKLQGTFSLHYNMPKNVLPGVRALLQGGITPILATRDFNITPEVLHRRFKLPDERMQYPPVVRRYDLSAKGQPHNPVLGGLIYREGIVPFVDAILGGRRLRVVVLLNTILTVLSSVVGSLLGLYLTGVNAFQSLSLGNMLFFLLMWLLPTVLISRAADQF